MPTNHRLNRPVPVPIPALIVVIAASIILLTAAILADGRDFVGAPYRRELIAKNDAIVTASSIPPGFLLM